MAQRYAKRRIMEQGGPKGLGGVVATNRSTTTSQTPPQESTDWRSGRDWRMREQDRGSRYLAATLLERYDYNRNGKFDPPEIAATGIEAGQADFNRDGRIDGDDLGQLLANWGG